MVILSTDGTAAFDSVKFSHILDACKRRGAPDQVLAALESALTGRQVRVITAHGLTQPRPVRRGIGQGSVEGPTYYILSASETYLQLLDPPVDMDGVPAAFVMGSDEHANRPETLADLLAYANLLHLRATAFADDNSQIAKSLDEATLRLRRELEVQKRVGIKVNLDKSLLITTRIEEDGPTHVEIDGTQVPVHGPEAPAARFLGAYADPSGEDGTTKDVCRQSTEAFHLSNRTGAPSSRELRLLYNMKHNPAMAYRCATVPVTDATLTSIDAKARQLIRNSLKLPRGYPNSSLHSPVGMGGYGFEASSDSANVLALTEFYNILNTRRKHPGLSGPPEGDDVHR